MSESWDVVIVGAGAAGCVLADRLSADARLRVLLLEAGGPDRSPWIKIPAGFARTLFDPALGWGYVNAASAAVAGREIPCPRGRVLGGSSSINGHLYVRGQARDYDDWAAQGARGWAWADVLPVFKRSETRLGGDPRWRGRDGPLHVTDLPMRHPICEAFLQSLEALGERRNPDYNSGDQQGCGYYQTLIRAGRRWSAADAWLRAAMRRPNLAVRMHALATRVLFDGRRAVGIEYREQGRIRQALARVEVILAAGAINTPQLLQLSGVGPPELLQSHGIETIHCAPGVGAGLVDHYAVRVAARVRGRSSLNERSHGLPLLGELARYALRRRGLLASPVAHAHAFIALGDASQRPDTQLLFTPASYPSGRMGQAGLEREAGLTCGVCVLRPHSRGHVRIRSRDAMTAPEIQPNYLSDPRDLALTMAAVRYVRRLYHTPPLADIVTHETWPGAQVHDDEALESFVRQTGSTVYHPVGTCAMGSAADAPLTDRLALKGLAGLRVIDASAMPSMVSGNTYAATIMIAERGAEFVLADLNRH
ncbi:MAG: GMC family oxidoreductase N-terminal domain-containing protein [Burkholderiaceae bacterium]